MVEKTEWQRRAKAAGLSQRELARMLGRDSVTMSRHLTGRLAGGVPQHVQAVIVAWELMRPDQRDAWRKAMAAGGEGET